MDASETTEDSNFDERHELRSNGSRDVWALNESHAPEVIYKSVNLPSLVVRIKALFVDLLIVLAIFTATTLFIDAFGDIPSFVKGFILIFMLYLYDPILTSLTGSTIGHKLMKLKVRKYRNPESKISLGQALFRFLIKLSLGWISFLTVTSNKQKRALHDLASGSIILKQP